MACSSRTPWQATVSRLIAERGVTVTRNLAFGPGDRDRYDLYEPPTNRPIVGVAQFVYGGSWETGERGCYEFVGAALAKRGIRTVIADYRLYPDAEFPEFVQDAARAYVHTWLHHRETTAAPILIGHSAGAHIAALLAGDVRYISDISSDTPPPQKFIGLSGPYAFDPTTWDTTKHIFTRAQATPEIARPIALATADFPETLLIHGARDEIVTPNASTEFHDALTAAGARSHLHIVRHLGHAGPVLAFAKPLRWWGPTLRLITAFVRPGGDVRKQQRRVKTAEVAPIA